MGNDTANGIASLMAPLLVCPKLSVTLHSEDSAFHLSADGFYIHAGEIALVTGPSGSGKSLLLELVSLVRRPDPKAIFGLDLPGEGVDLSRLWQTKDGEDQMSFIRRQMFGFVPQAGDLLSFLSVRNNISLPQHLAGRVDLDWVDTLITQLDLATAATRPVAKLSVGQRQRVAIARALSNRPKLIIADEPTAALDQNRTDRVLDLFTSLAREVGSAVLIATHDMSLTPKRDISHWVCDHHDSQTQLRALQRARHPESV